MISIEHFQNVGSEQNIIGHHVNKPYARSHRSYGNVGCPKAGVNYIYIRISNLGPCIFIFPKLKVGRWCGALLIGFSYSKIRELASYQGGILRL